MAEIYHALADPGFQRRTYGVVDCGSLLWHLQNERLSQVLGTAGYQPPLPLVPTADREEQARRGPLHHPEGRLQ